MDAGGERWFLPVASADDREGRRSEIVDRTSLAQELGVEAEVQIVADRPRGRCLQFGQDPVARGSRGHRAAQNHGVRLGCGLQCLPDLLGHRQDERQVGSVLDRARGANADERGIGGRNRLRGVGRCRQRPCRESVLQVLAHTGLADGGDPVSQSIDLRGIGIDAPIPDDRLPRGRAPSPIPHSPTRKRKFSLYRCRATMSFREICPACHYGCRSLAPEARFARDSSSNMRSSRLK